MGGIKVAASGPAAHGFLAYLSIANNRSWGNASHVVFSASVFMDCSGVMKFSSYALGLFFCGRVWDVSRRPRQKNKKFLSSFKFARDYTSFGTTPFDGPRFPRQNFMLSRS